MFLFGDFFLDKCQRLIGIGFVSNLVITKETLKLINMDTNEHRTDVKSELEALGIKTTYHYNLTTAELIEHALQNEDAQLASNGALVIKTGRFTGRSPKDRYIVKDSITTSVVSWGPINQPFDKTNFLVLKNKLIASLSTEKLYVREAFAGADKEHRIGVRVIGTHAWHSLFCKNMFIEASVEELGRFASDFTIISNPDFKARPETDGTRSKNFTIIDFEERLILIGGSGYTGESKKAIFSVLNFLLPTEKKILPMHCSATKGLFGDTAVFFGLSGTGKTTLSADPNRWLIGDDEHAWTDEGIFNFEGGCYAKVINLSQDAEPTIYDAIKHGALVENTAFKPNTRDIDYGNSEITQNTRVSYPLSHIIKRAEPSLGWSPKNMFFLTCDATGVLPPISKLTPAQAMYHFMSGYTAKVAGTEMGIKEPQVVFSACFGAPFMPLHPYDYAELLGQRIQEFNTRVWLINTGWTGGAYGTGHRISLDFTREMVASALNGELDDVTFVKHDVFNVDVPKVCGNIPQAILDPSKSWNDPKAYEEAAFKLADLFVDNFRKFEDKCSDAIKKGGPNVLLYRDRKAS